MRRWAVVTLFLYALLASILATPILWVFVKDDPGGGVRFFLVVLLPVLVTIQAVLLLMPVAVARQRPVKARTAAASAMAGAFVMAILLSCFVWFVLNMLLGENRALEDGLFWIILGILFSLWILWGIIFFRGFTAADPDCMTERMMRWLLRGSILEILIAIPAHILARHRHECCAPDITLLGLVTGIAVALMSFGPGLFFLFAARVREKRVATNR